jgi:hypothetical protein
VNHAIVLVFNMGKPEDKKSFMQSLGRKRAAGRNKKFVCAIEKMDKGKRLSSDEFLSVHSSIWQVGPSVRYEKAHKWERCTRDGNISKNSAPF